MGAFFHARHVVKEGGRGEVTLDGVVVGPSAWQVAVISHVTICELTLALKSGNFFRRSFDLVELAWYIYHSFYPLRHAAMIPTVGCKLAVSFWDF